MCVQFIPLKVAAKSKSLLVCEIRQPDCITKCRTLRKSERKRLELQARSASRPVMRGKSASRTALLSGTRILILK
jgi:hypothetical protein